MLERRLLALTVLAFATPSIARADSTFGAGSIILPASAPYQTDCGAIAIYGVVYNVLRANPWLQANGYGTIEVYYAFKDSKQSPNRCTPTNLHAGPAYSGVPSPQHDDAKWNDGCDFQVFSNSLVPVAKMVNTTATSVASDLASFATVNTSSKTSGKAATFPNWPSRTIQHTAVPSTNVTTVRYWGGPFIIDDADAPVLRQLIQGTLVANDLDGNPISFTNFKSGACSFGTSNGGQVNFHVAQTSFTAPTPKIFSTPPPRLALVATDSTAISGSTSNVFNNILQDYLLNAGLSFVGAQGCPLGGYLATNSPAMCPSPNKTGQIFDLFDISDIAAGRLNTMVSGQPVYKMVWAPHWESSHGTLTASEQNIINAISSFADNQRGVMAECASIELFEGTNPGANDAITNGHYMGCTGSGTTCTSSPSRAFNKNSGGSGSPDPTFELQNCTDPTLSNGSNCAYFSSPGDSFAQTADYRWYAFDSSQVADYKPASGIIYKPGTQVLISGVSNLNKTLLTNATTARGMINGDFAVRGVKDNDPNKSNVLYLGGHDQTSSVSGNKLVLQTLLQLGDPPVTAVTEEVARSTPIIGNVGGVKSLLQGSFDEITPPPTTTTLVVDGDAAAFRFPYLQGHIHAVDISSGFPTTGTALKDLPDFFPGDSTLISSEGIPPPTPSGCATDFAGSCRTVFTNTVTGLRPPRVIMSTANGATLGPLMATGLTTTSRDILISRVLGGIEFPAASGTFVPRLGGIDRSSVAVAPPSVVVPGGATRPTMVYVGAADGMMHAFCGSVVAATPCGTSNDLGREIWGFIPRQLLSSLRMNTQRIQGSPRIVDLFGDFDGDGTKRFHTILLFQTGTGDPSVAGKQPAVYALDVSNPFDPKIVWEYTTPATRGVVDFGQGLTVTTGSIQITSGAVRNAAFVQTNNGGTGASGTMVTAIDIETGTALWTHGHIYPAPRVAASGAVPASGVPEGAVGVDKTNAGRTTDVIFNTLYGDIWELNASNGVSQYGATTPLFRFTTDKKPLGVTPTIYGDGTGNLYTVTVSGGYYDPAAAALWSGNAQQVVSVNIAAAAAGAPYSEATTPSPSTVAFVNNLAAGDKGFAQVIVIGGQIFVTTDSTDINATGYGQGTDSGHLYAYDVPSGSSSFSAIVIAGGAGSIAHDGTTLMASSRDAAQQLTTAAASTTSASTNSSTAPKIKRRIWLRTL